ncbi:hypothetical protein [Phenylobacterium sp.]|uniref:hypothetical protein n=1 Tax=Phenylobacterium sp. TaxID=1871053 RepID=UPI0028110565|nr:hypothetical protein [Phenylobacterium sp.]
MRGLALGLTLMLASGGAAMAAETLAVCGAVSGRAYYVGKGLVPDDEAGWTDDRIGNGKITLTRDAKGELDVLFADSTGAISSSRAEGAVVFPGRMASDDAAVIVAYPGASLEIYHFVRDRAGKHRVILVQSKGGTIPITKGSVMVGECSSLDLPSS